MSSDPDSAPLFQKGLTVPEASLKAKFLKVVEDTVKMPNFLELQAIKGFKLHEPIISAWAKDFVDLEM